MQTGIVYAVEFSHRSGRDLVNMAKKRTNVIPIIEDARHPMKYRMLVGMVDVIFADVAQPDQVLHFYFEIIWSRGQLVLMGSWRYAKLFVEVIWSVGFVKLMMRNMDSPSNYGMRKSPISDAYI